MATLRSTNPVISLSPQRLIRARRESYCARSTFASARHPEPQLAWRLEINLASFCYCASISWMYNYSTIAYRRRLIRAPIATALGPH